MSGQFQIREYINQARDQNGHILPAGEEPAIATQSQLSTGTSALMAVLNERTRFVLLSNAATGAATSVSWEIGASPTAVLASGGGKATLASLEKQFLGVQTGGKNAGGTRTPLRFAIITDL